jgi:uncharacterized protein
MDERDRAVVARVRAELEAVFGDRLRQLILFGSRARGDAREESDYDFVAVLDEVADRARERDRMSDLGLRLLLEEGFDASILPRTADDLRQSTLLMHDVRAEGVPV